MFCGFPSKATAALGVIKLSATFAEATFLSRSPQIESFTVFFWFLRLFYFFLAASLASGSPSALCLHTVSVSLGHLVPFHAHLTFNCYSEHFTVPKQQQLDFQNRTSVQIFQELDTEYSHTNWTLGEIFGNANWAFSQLQFFSPGDKLTSSFVAHGAFKDPP